MIEEIRSKDNQSIRLIKKLAQKKYRDELGQFIAEGPNLMEEALNCGASIRFAVVCNDENHMTPQIHKLAERLELAGIRVYSVERNLFNEVSDTETPQGILGVIDKKVYNISVLFEHGSLTGTQTVSLIVLDRVQDPGNLGTILRTADAAGYQGAIMMKGCGDIYAPKAVRATAGSVFRMPLLFVETPEQAIDLLHQNGMRILCTTPRGKELPYDIDMSGAVALVIGNEANGASPVFIDRSDHQIMLPMTGSIESLNASVAAGILMYETVRQKLK